MSVQINPINGSVWLAAGGTGGHVFPALHTADALKARGFDVSIITDKRGLHLVPEKYNAGPLALPLLLPVPF